MMDFINAQKQTNLIPDHCQSNQPDKLQSIGGLKCLNKYGDNTTTSQAVTLSVTKHFSTNTAKVVKNYLNFLKML